MSNALLKSNITKSVCCLESKFCIISCIVKCELLYNAIDIYKASTNRWKILKGCLGDEKVLKSLYDSRWEAHAVAIEAILKSYPQIIEALQYLQEDYSQKGYTRREAENIANKMQELEFAFMLIFWEIFCCIVIGSAKLYKIACELEIMCRFVFLISRLLACV